MDASQFIGPGITLVVLGGGYLLAEGSRRQRQAELERRIERFEKIPAKQVEHEIRIQDLERRVTTHKHDIKEEIDQLRRRINGKHEA